MNVVCAWCNKTLSSGLPDDPVSHGVCPDCAAKLAPTRRGTLQQLLDHMRQPAIAVDAKISAMCMNQAAQKTFGAGGHLIQGKLIGDIIECAHASRPEGCGRTVHCSGCTIRRMAMATFQDGQARCSVEAEQLVRGADGIAPVRYSISTQKVADAVLIIIEDLKSVATCAPFAEEPVAT